MTTNKENQPLPNEEVQSHISKGAGDGEQKNQGQGDHGTEERREGRKAAQGYEWRINPAWLKAKDGLVVFLGPGMPSINQQIEDNEKAQEAAIKLMSSQC